jgi:hypothetical protein
MLSNAEERVIFGCSLTGPWLIRNQASVFTRRGPHSEELHYGLDRFDEHEKISKDALQEQIGRASRANWKSEGRV